MIYYENTDPEAINTFDPPEIPDDLITNPTLEQWTTAAVLRIMVLNVHGLAVVSSVAIGDWVSKVANL
ncbi:hypothetical protein LguiA_008978 [Lonicera macranthoides]